MNQAAVLLDLCRRLLDPDAKPRSLHAGHNGTVVLRAVTAVGEVIVKVHRGSDRHRQEVHAYRHWAPALSDLVPRLLAYSDDPPAIVISALAGRPLAVSHLTPGLEAEAYRQSGELLQRLHTAGPPSTEPNLPCWLAERGEYWLALAETLLPATRRAEIRAHLHALANLGPIPAVPCHLDYTPRNLLCATPDTPTACAGTQQHRMGGGNPTSISIGAIDFEHARYDLAARDLVRLATRTWIRRPDLEHAFLMGYGPLDDIDRQVIEHCSHLDALTNVVRSAQRSGSPIQGAEHPD
ncbi:aminoglycoside phosphotransferase family protein [Actinoplanes sp. NPDC049681]|uniref:aminoglycoside phosphotransferase family protein n=1 Tax=Actinoplanes sp. NPDC049681 TaxID=3363905 RepID=UPI00378B2822